MANARSGLYDDPEIYDILHAPGTRDEVDGLEQIERRFVDPALTARARLWLEPACGSGRYLREANRRGIDTVGFDLSEGMIGYARDHSPAPGAGVGRAEYFNADMTDFARRLGRRRASFAFNLINTIRHLTSDQAMLAHLGQVAQILAPGGVYVVGISLTAYGAEAPSEDVWVGARGRRRVTQVVQFIPPNADGNARSRSELVISHLAVESAGGTQHRDSRYRLRTYSLEQWKDLIERSPLEVVAEVDEVGQVWPAADGGYHLFVMKYR